MTDNKLEHEGWDKYWEGQEKKTSGKKLYDFIAEFYRKFIIRPALNHFIFKYFPHHSELLHAGCGSGQVDRDIRNSYQITGLDISKNALEIFKRECEGKCKVLQGSIFDIPLTDGSVDGIYNLGVMEHFTEEEIRKILENFIRVLKVNGKVVLFWPPDFGLSVIFLGIVKRILRPFAKKKIQFFPDEISRIHSKKFAYEILAKSNFKVIEYYFGIRDVFTYCVIVAEK